MFCSLAGFELAGAKRPVSIPTCSESASRSSSQEADRSLPGAESGLPFGQQKVAPNQGRSLSAGPGLLPNGSTGQRHVGICHDYRASFHPMRVPHGGRSRLVARSNHMELRLTKQAPHGHRQRNPGTLRPSRVRRHVAHFGHGCSFVFRSTASDELQRSEAGHDFVPQPHPSCLPVNVR